MKPGLYAFRARGFDGVDWPVGGVAMLQDGLIVGGGAYTYFTGWYTSQDGVFKAELTLNEHTPAPPHTCSITRRMSASGLRGGMWVMRLS